MKWEPKSNPAVVFIRKVDGQNFQTKKMGWGAQYFKWIWKFSKNPSVDNESTGRSSSPKENNNISIE